MCDKRGDHRADCGLECTPRYSASVVGNTTSNERRDALRDIVRAIGKRHAEADHKYQHENF